MKLRKSLPHFVHFFPKLESSNEQSSLLQQSKVVHFGTTISYNPVNPPDFDPHFLNCSDCARHFRNYIIRDIQNLESFQLPHILMDFPKISFLIGAQSNKNPSKISPFCS